MKRSVVPTLTAVALLSVPAVAEASFLDSYQRLAERHLSPAPLVPTTIPKAFRPIDRASEVGSTIGGRGYAVRLVHQGPLGPDAVIEVSGGEFRSIRALWRERRREGYSSRSRTRVVGSAAISSSDGSERGRASSRGWRAARCTRPFRGPRARSR